MKGKDGTTLPPVNRKSLNKAVKVFCKGDAKKHQALAADVREGFKAMNIETNGAFYASLEEVFSVD